MPSVRPVHLRSCLAVFLLGSALLMSSAHASDSIVLYVKVKSTALKRAIPVGIYLPPGYDDSDDTRYPVVYFLHGMFGDHRKWEERGCPEVLDQLIEEKKVPPMIVVAPSGERSSFWVNWVNGKNDWEVFVTDDLVRAVDAGYRTVADRDHRGITGDSMGGYGALNLGFKHPTLFGSVSAHSAMLYSVALEDLPGWVLERADSWGPIYGAPVDEAHWRANHPIHLAMTKDADALRTQRIYFDCGADDRFGFDAGARALDEALTERDVPHEAYIRDGNHGSDYFRRYVPLSLAFHGAAFTVALAPSTHAGEDSETDPTEGREADAGGETAEDDLIGSGE